MKKILLIFAIFAMGSSMTKAQTQDSCYVYANLHWYPNVIKSKASIQLSKWEFEDLKDENGVTLPFNSFIHALNYMSIRGWSLVETYPIDAELVPKNKEMTALIRKKMSIKEAQKYTGLY